LKSLEKEVILSWKRLENQSDFCTNPAYDLGYWPFNLLCVAQTH